MKRSGALDGVRIVDLTTVLMGPLACRMLADHGADVIQVVPPNAAGGITAGASGMGGIALDIHRNKRSVRLDLKSAMGMRALNDLIASSDVLITNMRAAALDRLGLSARQVRARQPRLIYCLANGYGQTGPYAERAAYDDAIQALSGFASLSSRIGGDPAYAPSVVVDKVCALFVVQAVMAALLHRANAGEGQTIEVPMFETMVAFTLVEHYRGAALIPPKGSPGYQRLLNPERRPYRSADGWVALLPYSEANWRTFFEIIGQPELADDPRYITHDLRMQNIESLYRLVREAAPSRTTQEWMTLCDAHSIPCNPVLELEQVLADPHLAAVDLFPVVDHPVEGPYHAVRDPVSYDTLDTSVRRPAPIPGEHTGQVLAEVGWSSEDIAKIATQ